MKLHGYFLLIAGAGALAFVLPDAQQIRSLAASAPAEPLVVEPGQVQQLDWYGGGTVLERQSDGHFYADALVQGAPVRFLVDTGASMVALTAADAEAAGIGWDPAQVRVIGQGASGPVHGVMTSVPELELGDFAAHNVPAAIIPEGLGVSLLGQSFLGRVPSVRIEGAAMVLSAE